MPIQEHVIDVLPIVCNVIKLDFVTNVNKAGI